MSLDQVQVRTAEITARIAMLRQGTPLATAARGVLGSTGVTPVAAGTDDAFAALLAQAQKRGAPASATAVTAPSSVASSTDVALGERVLASAREHLGVPYVWGGEDPSGFDCSGLVQYAFAKNGIDLPRVSQDQAHAGREVPLADAVPGDLVFSGDPVDHVGINAGDG
ncbi:MAG: C40 family peptidase, partial [Cellulomonas sp.]|nr:C40 family peptidase [Cellulomonas sp.]